MNRADGGGPPKKLKTRGTASRGDKSKSAEKVTGGFFEGVHAFFIARGISKKRLEVWQTRFKGLGGTILETATASSKLCDVIHILAADETILSKEVDLEKLKDIKNLNYVRYGWVEDCLKDGQLLSCDPYRLSQNLKHLNVHEERIAKSIPLGQSDVCRIAVEADAVKAGEASMISNKVVDQANFDGSILQNVVTESRQEKKPATEISRRLLDSEDADDLPLEDDEVPDYNKHVAGILKEMSSIYEDFFGDKWRALTYRKAANTLDKLPFRVSNAEDLRSIQGLGTTTIKKIKEILQTGQLQKLASLKADPKVQVVQQFASVWGIGSTHARRLYQAGHRSLEDISQDPSLSSMARIGLKYHSDIILRIPRAEVAEAGAFAQRVLEDICPGAWLTVGGSYRRGQPTCGDIDLLITHPDGLSHKSLISKLVAKLQDINFLTLKSSSGSQNHHNFHKVDTYMGICKLPKHAHYRRIDIKIYPKDIYAFALVYFTGNDVLNRRIRYFARTKGYKLSDQGLFPRVGYADKGLTSDVSIACETEQEIFQKLGLPYPEPEDRNW